MIGYIEFEDARKIGNLALDFCKNNGGAYNTIVLAGVNGSGKTSILEAIANFQNGSYLWETSSVKKVEYFDADGIRHEILRDEECKRSMRPEDVSEQEWDAMSEYTEQDFWKEKEQINEKTPFDIRNRKLVFSEARSGFEVDLKRNTRSYNSGDEKYEKYGANYSGLVQLLIDLEEIDNEEYICYAKFHSECTYGEYMQSNSRTSRFKIAFESMFEDIQYMGKDPRMNDDSIYFVKAGQQININELSTGEMQIVFRGTDLLYHASDGATVIIDEPELSLHPKWQKKILGFYRSLFTDTNGKQTAQLIIATHSQYIVQSAMNDKDNVKVIILDRDDLNVKANTIEEAMLGTYSSAEVNYLAFGVDKMDYHIQLFGALHNALQDISGSGVTNTIASIDQYIRKHPCYDVTKHEREDTSYKNRHYYTLPAYIRNEIDHPDGVRSYNEGDMDLSIELLRAIYKDLKMNK